MTSRDVLSLPSMYNMENSKAQAPNQTIPNLTPVSVHSQSTDSTPDTIQKAILHEDWVMVDEDPCQLIRLEPPQANQQMVFIRHLDGSTAVVPTTQVTRLKQGDRVLYHPGTAVQDHLRVTWEGINNGTITKASYQGIQVHIIKTVTIDGDNFIKVKDENGLVHVSTLAQLQLIPPNSIPPTPVPTHSRIIPPITINVEAQLEETSLLSHQTSLPS